MVKLTKTDTSRDRIYSTFKDKTLSEITLIQTAWINKDWKEIKRLVPNSKAKKKSSFLGIGRLANQYITELANPTIEAIDYAQRKHNVKLVKSGNKAINLEQNVKRVKERIKRGPTGPSKRVNLFPFRPYSVSHTVVRLEYICNKPMNINFVDSILSNFLNDIQQEINQYNATRGRKIIAARLTIKYRLSDNSIHYYSTKKEGIFDFILDSLSAIQRLTINDFAGWNNVSPKNEEMLIDLYNKQKSITRILEVKIVYYH